MSSHHDVWIDVWIRQDQEREPKLAKDGTVGGTFRELFTVAVSTHLQEEGNISTQMSGGKK